MANDDDKLTLSPWPELDAPATPTTGGNKRAEAFRRAAAKLGISDPADLAAIVSFESAGSFDPHKVGGEGNRYRGLIQFGPEEQKKYYRQGQSFEDQLEDGVVRFFQDRFKQAGKPLKGATLEDLYTTVIAGNPNANRNAKDAFGTSARSGAARIAKEHKPKVLQNIFGGVAPVAAPIANPFENDDDILSWNAPNIGGGTANSIAPSLASAKPPMASELMPAFKPPQVAPPPTNPTNVMQTPVAPPAITVPPTVPEAPSTLQAQTASVVNNATPRAAILFTDESQMQSVPASFLLGLTRVDTPNGILMVNPRKAEQLGIQDIGAYVSDKGFAELIGKAVDVGNNTSGGWTVVTLDAQGRELSTSIVDGPEAAKKQAEIDKASFPNAAEQRVMPAEDAIKIRTAQNAQEQMPQQGLAAPVQGADSPEVTQAYQQFLADTQMPDGDEARKEFNVVQATLQAKGDPTAEQYENAVQRGQNQPQTQVKGQQPNVQAQTGGEIGEPEGLTTVYSPEKIAGSAKEYYLSDAANQVARKYDVDPGVARAVIEKYETGDENSFKALQRRGGRWNITTTPEAIEEMRAMDGEKKRRELQSSLAFDKRKTAIDPNLPQIDRELEEFRLKTMSDAEQGIISERDADAAYESLKKDIEATKEYLGTFTDNRGVEIGGRQDGQSRRVGGSTAKQQIDKAYADIKKQYGNVGEFVRQQKAYKDKFKNSPNLFLLKSGETAVGAIAKAPLKGASSLLKTVSIAAEAIDRGLGDENADATKMGFYQMGKALDDITEEAIKTDKDFKGGSAELFGDVFGQVTTQVLLGIASGGTALPVIFGAGLGASAEFDEANEKGAKGWERLGAAGAGGMLAASDYFIFRKWFGTATPADKAKFFQRVQNNVRTSLESKGIIRSAADKAAQQATDGIMATLAKQSGIKGIVGRGGQQVIGKSREGFKEAFQEGVLETKGNDLYAYLTYDPSPERWNELTTITKENLVEGVAGFFGGIIGASAGEIATRAQNLDPKAQKQAGDMLERMADEMPQETVDAVAKALKIDPPKVKSDTVDAVTFTDKKGETLELVEDKGDKVLVKNEKGGIVIRNKSGLTEVQPETQIVQESSAPVEPEALEADTVSEVPDVQDEVKPTRIKPFYDKPVDGLEVVPVKGQGEGKSKPLSNTQVEFSPEQAKPFDDFRRSIIDKADVADKSVLPEYAKDGIFEIEPHVTVKYGLATNLAEDVKPTLKGEKPITLKLGKTSVFKGSDKKIPGTDKPVPYDVVIVEVQSKDLERLNKKLTEGQENTTTFPYSPHVTLAYVKSGQGEKYANRTDFEGQEYTFDGVTFSPADKSGKSVISLAEATLGDRKRASKDANPVKRGEGNNLIQPTNKKTALKEMNRLKLANPSKAYRLFVTKGGYSVREDQDSRELSLEKGEDKQSGVQPRKLGDYIEFFGEDAETVGKALNVTITTRRSDGSRIAGVPEHSWDRYKRELEDQGITINEIIVGEVNPNAPDLAPKKTPAEVRAERRAEREAKAKTVADVPTLPKSQQVSAAADPTVKETKNSVKDEKINARTGLTPTQTEFLAQKLQDAAYKAMQFGNDDPTNFIAEFGAEGLPINSSAYSNEIPTPEFIKVPGDGSFKVITVNQANRLHQKITGKPIPGFAKDRTATIPQNNWDKYKKDTAKPNLGKPSKVVQDQIAAEQSRIEDELELNPDALPELFGGEEYATYIDGRTGKALTDAQVANLKKEAADAEAEQLRKLIDDEGTDFSRRRIAELELKKRGGDAPLKQAANIAPELDTLINDNGEIDYEKIRDVAGRIESGELAISRLDTAGEQGRVAGGKRNVEATLIIAANEAASERSGSRVKPAERQERILEEYAKREGIWFDAKEFAKEQQGFISKGVEAYVHRADDNFVHKLLDYKMIEPKATPLNFIDRRISLFNSIFPGTAYELAGFTRTGDDFRFVVKQRFIRDAVFTSPTERQAFMKNKGFEMTDKYGEAFTNPLYKVHDLHEKNALKGKDGTIFVIDAVPKLADGVELDAFTIEQADAPLKQAASDDWQSRVEAEMDAVEEVRNADGRLLAPNGKPSNLNEFQWKQVRTPSFIEYFGDWQNDPENASKVVDENGEPAIFYHGTDKNISVFKGNKTAQGVHWFTSDKAKIERGESGAAATSTIIPAFLNVRNPAGWTEYEKLGLGQIEDRGFDGIELDDDFVIFESNQIKSATNNRGTFDPSEDSILKQAADVSDLGFFSQVERTLEQKMPNKASADQVRGILKDAKREELEWLDIDGFLEGKTSVTKDELLDYVRANNVEVTEVVKDEAGDAEVSAWWNDEGGANESTPWSELSPSEQMDANDRYNDEVGAYDTDNTKFSQYVLPGGENYRELLLTMPQKKVDNPFESRQVDGKWVVWNTPKNSLAGTQPDANTQAEAEFVAKSLNREAKSMGRDWVGYPDYKSSHWDEPNVIAHVRFDDRDGGKTLHVAEIQSDLHQEGRKKGYKNTERYNELLNAYRRGSNVDGSPFTQEQTDEMNALNVAETSGVPNFPFKKSWHELAIKRIIRYAAENSGNDAWREVTQPQSPLKIAEHILGSDLAAVTPLKVMDIPVLLGRQNDEIQRAIVKAIPVNVVDVLARQGFTPEQLTSEPNVVGKALTVEDRATVARGFASALALVGTRTRATLLRVLVVDAGRGNLKEVAAIRAMKLDPSIVGGFLSPSSIYGFDGNVPLSRLGGAFAGAKAPFSADDLTRESPELGVTEIAEALNRHDAIITGNASNVIKRYVPGYQRITWDSGETNAERYDLSKQVDEIVVIPYSTGTRAVRIDPKDGTSFRLMVDEKGIVDGHGSADQFTGKSIDDVVGKEIGQRIMEATENTDLQGDNLKVGGEGMRGFYDKILPSTINKYVKKWGGKVEGSEVETASGKPNVTKWRNLRIVEAQSEYQLIADSDTSTDVSLGYFESKGEAEAELARYSTDRKSEAVHSLTITDAMKDAVMQGQPLFKRPDKESKDYLLKTLVKAHPQDLMAATSVQMVDGNLELNEEAGELLRRLIASEKLADSGSFFGVTMNRRVLLKLASAAKTWASKFRQAGYLPSDVKGLVTLSDSLLELANQSPDNARYQGAAYVFDDALPEEMHHKRVKEAGGLSNKAVKALKSNPLWKSPLMDRLYPGISDQNRAIEIAAKLATGQNEFWKGKPDEDAKKAFLTAVADDIIANNLNEQGEITLDKEDYKDILEYASDTTTNEGRSGQDADTGQGSKRDAKPDRDTGEGTRTEVRDETEKPPARSGPTEKEITKDRQFAKSMTKHLMDIADVPYEPQSFAKWTDYAEGVIADKGIDGAMDEWRKMSGKDNEGRKTALGVVIAKKLRDAGRDGDYRIFGEELVNAVGNIAQELAAAKMLSRLNPDFAPIHGDKITQKAHNRPQTPEEYEKTQRLAEELKDAADREILAKEGIAQAEQRIANLEQQNADLEKLLESEKKRGKDTTSLEKALKAAKASAAYYKALVEEKRKSNPKGVRTSAQVTKFKEKVAANRSDYMKRIRDAFADGVLKMAGMIDAVQSQTETPQFKKWFGDSKVVDANGNPLMVYHGTPDDFDVFDINTPVRNGRGQGEGFYFAEDKEVAEKFAKAGKNKGRVISAYIKLTNPFKGFDGLTPAQKAIYLQSKSEAEAFQRLGVDGLVNGGTYIVFNPTQIKSAIGNDGNFDPNDPSILKQAAAPEIDPELLEALTDLSAEKILDGLESGLTPEQFNKWLDKLTNGSLSEYEKAYVHAMGFNQIRVHKSLTPEAQAKLRTRYMHARVANQILQAEEREARAKASEAIKNADAFKYDKFAKVMVDTAEKVDASDESVFVASLIRNYREMGRIKDAYAEAGYKDFNKHFVEAKNLIEFTKAEIDKARIEGKEGIENISKNEVARFKGVERVARKEKFLKLKELDNHYKELTRSATKKTIFKILDGWNFVRAVQFSMDAGFALAQGGPTMITNPKGWFKAMKTGIPAASETPALNRWMQKAGVLEKDQGVADMFRKIPGLDAGLNKLGFTGDKFMDAVVNAAESQYRARSEAQGVKYETIGATQDWNESIMSKLSEKIPLVAQSNKAHSFVSDLFRLHQAERYLKWLDDMEARGKIDAFQRNRAEEFMMKKWVNVMTGKGYLGSLDSLAWGAAQISSAPRYTVSAFQALWYANPVRILALPKGARLMVAQDSAKMYAVGGALIMLLGALGWMNLDPEDKDFLVLDANKIPGLRDLAPDMKIALVRWLKESFRLTIGLGLKYAIYQGLGNQDAANRIMRQWRNELVTNDFGYLGTYWKGRQHPAISLINVWRTGENYVGDPVGWEDVEEYTPLPLTIKETLGALKYDRKESILQSGKGSSTPSDNVQRMLMSVIANGIGLGANSYPSRDTTVSQKQAQAMMGVATDSRTEEEKEAGRLANRLERAIREGYDVTEELNSALAKGKINEKQAKALQAIFKNEIGKFEKDFKVKLTDEQKRVLMSHRRAFKILDYLWGKGFQIDRDKVERSLEFATKAENTLNDRAAQAEAEAIILRALLRSKKTSKPDPKKAQAVMKKIAPEAQFMNADELISIYESLDYPDAAEPLSDKEKAIMLKEIKKRALNANIKRTLTQETLDRIKQIDPTFKMVIRSKPQ